MKANTSKERTHSQPGAVPLRLPAWHARRARATADADVRRTRSPAGHVREVFGLMRGDGSGTREQSDASVSDAYSMIAAGSRRARHVLRNEGLVRGRGHGRRFLDHQGRRREAGNVAPGVRRERRVHRNPGRVSERCLDGHRHDRHHVLKRRRQRRRGGPSSRGVAAFRGCSRVAT